jgi:hypothetical protein
MTYLHAPGNCLPSIYRFNFQPEHFTALIKKVNFLNVYRLGIFPKKNSQAWAGFLMAYYGH